MDLSFIHARLSDTVLLYFLVMMVWSTWRFFRKQGEDPNYLGALLISEILVLFQGGLGLVLWFTSLRPAGGSMHLLYGVMGALGVPAVYAYTKSRPNRYQMLVYAVAYFLLGALIIRSQMTG
jgi:hypothetical protein